MSHFHALVWIDHREARVFHVTETEAERIAVQAHAPQGHVHHHAGSVSGKRAEVAASYLDAVVAALGEAKEWLIVGPGNAKLELVKHVHKAHPTLIARIAGVESADHPTDGELAAHARAYFAHHDHMTAQR